MDDLFDWEESRRRRDDGMARAEENASERWKAAVAVAIHAAAKAKPFLTTDDVVARIDPTASTHEPRALGPEMIRAMKAGWIIQAEVMPKVCKRPSRHAARITVWQSLVFEGA